MDNNSDAADALNSVAAARMRLAEQIYTPWWYHPLLGLFLGLLVIQIGGALGPPGMFLIPLPLLATLALGRVYRRLSGVDLYGPASPDGGQRGRSLLAIYSCALTACFASAFLMGHQFDFEWATWALALLVAGGTIGVGRAYDRLLRAELRSTTS